MLPYRLSCALNGLARGMTDGRDLYRSPDHRVELHGLPLAQYGTPAVHGSRSLGALIHLPVANWRAEFPGTDLPPRIGARWWCGKWSTNVFLHDDPRAPATHLCRFCLAARGAAERRARAAEIVSLIREGAILAPF